MRARNGATWCGVRAPRIGARAATRRHLRRSSVRECGGITRLEVPHHILGLTSEAEGPGEQTGNNTNGRSITKKHHTTSTKKKCQTSVELGLRPAAPDDGKLSGYRRSFPPTLIELTVRVLASPQTIERASSPFPPRTNNTNLQSHRPHEPFAPVPDPGPTRGRHPNNDCFENVKPPAKSSRAAPALSGHSPGRFDRHATTTPSAEESLLS
ncbi:hypothetical protein CMUS01_11127 [Colletotrichum musicola]|uniref:Uncharacterized protein n=1 Tax=Colletotrichum musicola TaxID=2175873 RepID=A0A8H6K055_9PEZI|nr:hypothetical protein CMUS01_11127 [Colletotrichum musicola]